MSTLEIKKCAVCSKLFQSLGTNVCAPCSEKIDQDFHTVRDYIYNAGEDVGVKEIVENTDVPEKTVLYLLKEGRLSQKNVRLDGRLKCAVCGAEISKGKLCSKCSDVWSNENKRLTVDRVNNPVNRPVMKTGNKMYTHHSNI